MITDNVKITEEDRKVYAEVDDILEFIPEDKRIQVPHNLRQLFKENRDPNHIIHLDNSTPIEQYALRKETLSMIALFNLKFWCKTQEEKSKLRKIYESNNNKT